MNILKVETNYKRNLFFSKTKVNYKNYSNNLENKVINIYPEIKYQEIIGFGGAFTEATGYAISSLSNENKKRVFLKIILITLFADFQLEVPTFH